MLNFIKSIQGSEKPEEPAPKKYSRPSTYRQYNI